MRNVGDHFQVVDPLQGWKKNDQKKTLGEGC